MNDPVCSDKKCRGAVLVISLIMILLLTTIGLVGMNAARLETVMAANFKQEKTVFNNAESAVTIGEAEWSKKLIDCLSVVSDCENATLLNLTPVMMDSAGSIDWDGGAGNSAGDFGHYHVEYLGQRMFPGESEKVIHIYRFTAYATDRSGTARTFVQTVYRYCLKLDGVPCPG